MTSKKLKIGTIFQPGVAVRVIDGPNTPKHMIGLNGVVSSIASYIPSYIVKIDRADPNATYLCWTETVELTSLDMEIYKS